jgi:hypothetical protein
VCVALPIVCSKEDDGAFWIEWSDFTLNFEDIYVCRFFEAPKWHTLPRIVSGAAMQRRR